MCPQFPLCKAESDEQYVTDMSEAEIKHRNFIIVRYTQRNEPLQASNLEEQDTINRNSFSNRFNEEFKMCPSSKISTLLHVMIHHMEAILQWCSDGVHCTVTHRTPYLFIMIPFNNHFVGMLSESQFRPCSTHCQLWHYDVPNGISNTILIETKQELLG